MRSRTRARRRDPLHQLGPQQHHSRLLHLGPPQPLGLLRRRDPLPLPRGGGVALNKGTRGEQAGTPGTLGAASRLPCHTEGGAISHANPGGVGAVTKEAIFFTSLGFLKQPVRVVSTVVGHDCGLRKIV